ncbi:MULTISPECIES: hypothetical protein [unclassified Amycolatopsis]|uniref:hypothetical protein n=1 Tax=unclassified Amycolatopsis TaxID=2618356 RepID=UPI002876E367|nr:MULTISPECIES: hypothetical protein [unclassified Amycolatopsis]MDS0140585.1 hypothetical protein [Amycolatopsis sp. 505]MDS0149235.1 hypothetical protein [Amycolatopsis sp. CM201R]
MSPHTWLHRHNRLRVRLGNRTEPVPEPVEGLLLYGPDDLTADVGADLLRLDGTLAALARRLRADAEAAAREITRHYSGRSAATHPVTGRTRADAVAGHTRIVEQLDDVTITIEVLREFVISLAPDGLLRDVAEGWQRNPEPPAYVEVILDEFLAAQLDHRRARPDGWGGSALAGIEEFGAHWRREPDDEPSELPPHYLTGSWVLGYLPTTTEVYAVRRAGSGPHTFWLLGTGLTTLDEATSILAPILPAMRCPNSLILAAETIHAARRSRAAHMHAEAG